MGKLAESNKIRIVLADDHGIVRTGLRHLLEVQPGFEVVAEAEDGLEAVEFAQRTEAEVVVLDVVMPHLNGIEAAAQIRKQNPDVAVVILSMYDSEEYLARSLCVGIRGYLLKESAQRELVPAIQAVKAGKAYFSPPIAQRLAEDYSRQLQGKVCHDSYGSLTDRERRVLQLIAEGRTSREIAGDLELSTYTVETHRTHIMHKLKVRNVAEMVLYAARKQLVS